jgi:hypothetical protein
MALRTAFRAESASAPLDFQIEVGPVELRAQVGKGELTVTQTASSTATGSGSPPRGEPELWFETGPGIRHLIAGTLSPARAVEEGVITIRKGNLRLLERFAELFRIDA